MAALARTAAPRSTRVPLLLAHVALTHLTHAHYIASHRSLANRAVTHLTTRTDARTTHAEQPLQCPHPPSLGCSRRQLICAGALFLYGQQPAFAANAETYVGEGFSLRVPRQYYKRPSGGAGPGDVSFLAGDYQSGRTISVTKVSLQTLLADAGDPLPLAGGVPKSMRELGKPMYIARLLSFRRDGDPLGLQPPRSEVISAEREGEVVRFVVISQTSTATSMTRATPSARVVQARTLLAFDRGGDAPIPYLLTVWASTPAARELQCEPVACDCGEGGGLRCNCPLPSCILDGDPLADSADAELLDSFTLM